MRRLTFVLVMALGLFMLTAFVLAALASTQAATPPTVVAMDPFENQSGVAISSSVTATFSEDMDTSTIDSTTFTLYKGAEQVNGVASYDSSTRTATFDPSSDLLTDTTYTATVTTGAKDLAGNSLSEAKVWNFSTTDTITPVTTLGAPPIDGENGWFKTIPSITLSRNEPGTTYYSWVSSTGPWTTYSAAFNAPEAENTLYYYSVDTASNTETVKSQLFKVDTISPTSSIISPTDGAYINGTSYVISGTATDPGSSGIFKVEVSINDGNWELAEGTTSWSYTWSLPSDGTYIIKSKATDLAGNIEVPSSEISVTLDNQSPSPPVITSPTDGYLTNNPSLTVSGTAEADSTVNLYDGGVEIASTTATGGSFTAEITLSEGTHTLTATATDLAGNESLPSQAISIEVDLTATTTTLSAPASDGENNWYVTTPTITLGANESASTYYQWDATDPSGWAPYLTALIAPEGTHTIYYYSVDTAGNEEAIKSQEFKVDTTPPATPTINPVTTPTNVSTQTIGGTKSEDTVTILVNGTSIGVTYPTSTTWSYNLNLSEGGNPITVIAKDEAGNESAPAISSITLDTQAPAAPVITFPPDGYLTNSSSLTVLGAAEEGSQVAIYDGATQVATTTASGGSFSADVTLSEGSHSLTARATDVAGNESLPSAEITVEVDLTSPVTTLSTDPVSPDGDDNWFRTAPTIYLSTTETGVTYYQWDSNIGPFTTYSTSLTAPEGTHTLYYYSVDTAGNEEAIRSQELKVDTIAPSSSIADPVDGAYINGISYIISGTALDPGSSGIFKVEVSINDGEWQVAEGTTSWNYTWTLPSDGTYTIKSRATDLAGNVEVPEEGATVTVDNTPPTTILSSDPLSPDGENDWFKTNPLIDLTATEPGITYYQWDSTSGTWLTASAFYAPEGDHILYYYSVDALGNSEDIRSQRIKYDGNNPTIVEISPLDGTKTNLAPPKVSVTLADSGGSGLNLDTSTLTVKVAGMTIAGTKTTDGSSTIIFTPQDPFIENLYSVFVTGKDNAGNLVIASANFVIDTTAPVVSSTEPANGATGINRGSNIQATFSEEMNPTTLNSSSFTLVESDSETGIAVSVSYDAATKTAILNPSSYLSYGKPYTATLATEVRDVAGNTLASNYTWIFAIDYRPATGTISPSSGTSAPGTAQTFTTTYSDLDGWEDIRYVKFKINTKSTAPGGVQVMYNQNTNKLYLYVGGVGWRGGYYPETNHTISNNVVILNYLDTSVSGSGNTLTVKWSLTFKDTFSGKKYYTYLYVKDDQNAYYGWKKVGYWKVNSAPAVGTISPSAGSAPAGAGKLFTTTYSDLDGWQNIGSVRLLINTSTRGVNAIYVKYDQNKNKLDLRSDDNTTWLGGYAPGSRNLDGSRIIVSNGYGRLDITGTTVAGLDDTLTVAWYITPKSTMSGKTYNTYLYVKDDVGAYNGFKKVGTWGVQ